MSLEEIKKALKDKNLTIGGDRVLKKAKLGKIKKIFVASNCEEKIKKRFRILWKDK